MGPATCTGPCVLYMKVECLQGAPSLVEPLTHTKLHTQVLGTLHGGRLVCLLQSLLLAVLMYTHHRGVGGGFLPWGKGLRFEEFLSWWICLLPLVNYCTQANFPAGSICLNVLHSVYLCFSLFVQVLEKIPLGDVDRIQFRSFKSVNRTLNENCSVDFSNIPYRIHIGK